MTTVRQAMNNGSLQGLPSFFQTFQLGDVLRKHLKFDLRNKTPLAAGADASVLATEQAIPMDPNAPASVILRAYGRQSATGGATPGELTVEPYGTTPATGQIAVAPNGDIVVLAADLWTSVDVEYLPCDGDLVVLAALPVSSNVLVLPAKYQTGVVYLRGVTATLGTSVGPKVVLAPGAGAPAAGQARLNLGTAGPASPPGSPYAKSTVTFAGADAVTQAIVTLYVAKGLLQGSTDFDTYLQQDAGDII